MLKSFIKMQPRHCFIINRKYVSKYIMKLPFTKQICFNFIILWRQCFFNISQGKKMVQRLFNWSRATKTFFQIFINYFVVSKLLRRKVFFEHQFWVYFENCQILKVKSSGGMMKEDLKTWRWKIIFVWLHKDYSSFSISLYILQSSTFWATIL